MDLRQFRYFIAVAEERHFRRAADRLHMSQPPLSQQIQAMEEELGVALFVRGRRPIRLTAAGETFLRRARAILEQTTNAAIEARKIGRGESGRLVIGFMSAAMLGRFPSLLRDFRAANPDVVVELAQLPPKEQMEAAAAGRIDLGFLAIAPLRQEVTVDGIQLEVSRIWEEELVAAVGAGHRLANQRTIALNALAGETFITLPRAPETGHYDQVAQLCRTRGRFRVNIGQVVEQLPAALALVAAGYGVSLVPACATDGWRGLVNFPRLKERPKIPVTIVQRVDNVSPVLAAFQKILRDERRTTFFPATESRAAR